MVVHKRLLLWDYTNTRDRPQAIDQLNFTKTSPFVSVSNWNAWTPPELKNRLPYRPMIRTPAQLEGNEWAMIVSNPQHQIVHYFNEPERIAGLTPQIAATKWRSQVVPQLRNAQHRKLVSPSCANDEAGRKWIRAFLGLVHDCPPDYLGVHYYGPSAGPAIDYIWGMYGEFVSPSKPGGQQRIKEGVIVSEVACTSRDAREVVAFTVALANKMDETGWIKEYGFFGCMAGIADGFVSPAAQLMDKDGKFTPLMRRLMTEQPMKV